MIKKAMLAVLVVGLGVLITLSDLRTQAKVLPHSKVQTEWPPDTIYFTRIAGSLYRAKIPGSDNFATVNLTGCRSGCPTCGTQLSLTMSWPPDTLMHYILWPPDTIK